MKIIWESFKEVGFSGLLDIAFMSLIVYTLLVWFKKTRAAFVLTGILIAAGIYLLTRQFNLYMTAAVFEKFFAVILIALVVIFQEELRHFFELIALWSLHQPWTRRKGIRLSRNEVDVLVRTLTDLARERIGALVVLRGQDLILRHLDGGIDLHGELSEPLLRSLFDPHSAGHDGAVVIEGNHITQFSCHLPLSKNLNKLRKGGTRHAAALGLSELSDALCLIVSEERGTISMTRNGEMKLISDPEHLTQQLEQFYQEVNPQRELKQNQDFFKRNWREKITALGLAVALWFVLVHGSKLTYKTFAIPISYRELPPPWVVTETSHKQVDVTFRGSRRAFYFMKRERIKLAVKLEVKKGAQFAHLSSGNLIYPKNLMVENIEPRTVKVRLEMREADKNADNE